MAAADFLDVTLDLNSGRYSPCRRPDDRPIYVNMESNHPSAILRQVPSVMSTRISKLSCDRDEFLKSEPFYDSILKEGGCSGSLACNPNAGKPPGERAARNNVVQPAFRPRREGKRRTPISSPEGTLRPAQVWQDIRSQYQQIELFVHAWC